MGSIHAHRHKLTDINCKNIIVQKNSEVPGSVTINIPAKRQNKNAAYRIYKVEIMQIPGTSQVLKNRIAESRAKLYRVAFAWCGDEMLADDLVQEAIETGMCKHKQLRDEKRLYSWLYTILHHHWHRYLRKAKPQTELSNEFISDDAGPMGTCQSQETIEQIHCAVALLPIDQKEVISLVDLEEFSYTEVAEILNIPMGTVMSRLHRARKNLLKNFNSVLAYKGKQNKYIKVVK